MILTTLDCCFNSKFFSNNYKRSGLNYEVALRIITCHICWCSGWYQAGLTDISMTHAGLDRDLPPGEKVLADNGHTGEPSRFVTTSKHISGLINLHKLRMARHTTVNKQLKYWSSLPGLFRHGKTT